MKTFFCAALLLVSLSVNATAQTIVIRGSDTLGDKMVPSLAEAYKKAGHSAQFDIVAEGSSEAFTGLKSGATIGMSSRPIKDSEKQAFAEAGMSIQEHVAGIDMIAVVLNEKNIVGDLPLDAVAKIFTGAAGTWKMLSGTPEVKAYTRDETSGTYKVFVELALNGGEYGPTTIKCASNGDIVKNVASNPGGVGYVGLSYANAPGVKAVKVNGVSPDPANSSTYPLSRKLYYYTIEGKASPEALAFIKWATTSPEAAEIISGVGFIAP